MATLAFFFALTRSAADATKYIVSTDTITQGDLLPRRGLCVNL